MNSISCNGFPFPNTAEPPCLAHELGQSNKGCSQEHTQFTHRRHAKQVAGWQWELLKATL
jgi:hypothetical protein